MESQADYLNARFNLANALRRSGEFDEAARHYRRVVQEDPRNASARIAEALALIRLHRYAETRDRLEDAVRALPE